MPLFFFGFAKWETDRLRLLNRICQTLSNINPIIINAVKLTFPGCSGCKNPIRHNKIPTNEVCCFWQVFLKSDFNKSDLFSEKSFYKKTQGKKTNQLKIQADSDFSKFLSKGKRMNIMEEAAKTLIQKWYQKSHLNSNKIHVVTKQMTLSAVTLLPTVWREYRKRK